MSTECGGARDGTGRTLCVRMRATLLSHCLSLSKARSAASLISGCSGPESQPTNPSNFLASELNWRRSASNTLAKLPTGIDVMMDALQVGALRPCSEPMLIT